MRRVQQKHGDLRRFVLQQAENVVLLFVAKQIAPPGAEYLRDPHPCGDEGDLQNYCPGQFTVAASRSVLGIAAFSSDLGICQT